MTTPSTHLPVASETHTEMELSLCPCCGAEFTGDLRAGCTACGARRVGPPLAMPAHLLPRLGRAAFTFAMGAALVGVLLVATAVELFGGAELSFGLWTIISAAESVAWRMKWTLIPVAFLSAAIGARFLWHEHFAVNGATDSTLPRAGGRKFTWAGAAMSACVACLVVTLIGVTIPERLRQREIAHEAEIQSLKYATHAAFLRYQARFGTLPDSFEDLRQLPDEDGAIALVLANFASESYKPSSVQAVARAPRSRSNMRRAADAASASPARMRRVAYNTNANDAATPSGLTYTNYDLVWFGEDKIPGTADDRVIRDGEFVTPPRHAAMPSASSDSSNTIRAKKPERANSR